MFKPRIKLSFGLGISLIVLISYLLGLGPLPLLLGSGALMGLWNFIKTKEKLPPFSGSLLSLFLFKPNIQTLPETFSLARLFWVFIKAGSLMYGSGYVLLAFIENDLVKKFGWLTRGQLIDAIAVGQITPGPLSTTATFVGYVTSGVPGAVLATFAMFLPGFIFVLITRPFLSQLRESAPGRGFLDGVIYASLGLWAGVTWEITGTALVDPVTVGISIISLFLLLVNNLNTSWLILGGAITGLIVGMIN